jgi:hypothetical protein
MATSFYLVGIGSKFQALGDTWVWDGANWSRDERLGSPPRRHSAAMSYDNIGQGVLMFRGLSGNGAFLADTWIWRR